MKTKTQSTIDMLSSVVDFGKSSEDQVPKDSVGGKAFAAIGAALTNMSEQAIRQAELLGQSRVSTVGRAAAREALRAQLDAISRAAQGMSVDLLGLDRKFRIPDFPRRDKGMIHAGETFAKVAGPLKEKFVEHCLAADFLERLNEAIRNLDQAIAEQAANKRACAEAAHEFETMMDDALTNLQRVDAIVPNALRGESAIAAWNVARRVSRKRRVKAPETEEKSETTQESEPGPVKAAAQTSA